MLHFFPQWNILLYIKQSNAQTNLKARFFLTMFLYILNHLLFFSPSSSAYKVMQALKSRLPRTCKFCKWEKSVNLTRFVSTHISSTSLKDSPHYTTWLWIWILVWECVWCKIFCWANVKEKVKKTFETFLCRYIVYFNGKKACKK